MLVNRFSPFFNDAHRHSLRCKFRNYPRNQQIFSPFYFTHALFFIILYAFSLQTLSHPAGFNKSQKACQLRPNGRMRAPLP